MNLSSALRWIEMGLGAYVGWYVNDNYATPLAEKIVPELQNDHTLSKVADTATMGAVSLGLGFVGHLLGLHRAADAVQDGGMFVTTLKAFTIPFSGLEAKLTVPNPLSLFRAAKATGQVASGSTSTVKQLPGAGGTTGSAASSGTPSTRPITASPLTDYGSLVAPTQDGGF